MALSLHPLDWNYTLSGELPYPVFRGRTSSEKSIQCLIVRSLVAKQMNSSSYLLLYKKLYVKTIKIVFAIDVFRKE